MPGLINNADGGFSLETIINAGGTNNSAVTALPPIILCPVGGLCQFSVPGSDPDPADTLNFRLSTSLEADRDAFTGFIQPTGASVDSMTGLYSWDSTGLGIEGDLFSTQVTIEDGTGAGRSKVAVDFLIELVTVDFNPPVVTGPAPDFDPLCDTTVVATTGVLTSFDILATDIDAENVTLNAAGLPAGATMTPPLPAMGFMSVQSTFDWTPTTSDVGDHVVNFDATTPSNGQTLCPVTIKVDEFVAVVEPAGDDNVTVFAGADDPDNDNAINMSYTQVDAAGAVTAGGCVGPALRETWGHGYGKFGYFKPKFIDIRKILDASDDPRCAELRAQIPKAIYISPTQRVLPNPNLSDDDRQALYFGKEPEDFAARAALRWVFYIITSDAVTSNVAVISGNSAKEIGYEGECFDDTLPDRADSREFRGVMGGTSIDPMEKIRVFRTTTWECDRSRSGRRSSTIGILLNMRNDHFFSAGYKLETVLSLVGLLSEVKKELKSTDCVVNVRPELKALLKQIKKTKKVFLKAKTAQKVLDKAVPQFDKLLLQAVNFPACPDNVGARFAELAGAAAFMACDYSGHPVDRVKLDCPISQDVLDVIISD